jgi:hypothetical protein
MDTLVATALGGKGSCNIPVAPSVPGNSNNLNDYLTSCLTMTLTCQLSYSDRIILRLTGKLPFIVTFIQHAAFLMKSNIPNGLIYVCYMFSCILLADSHTSMTLTWLQTLAYPNGTFAVNARSGACRACPRLRGARQLAWPAGRASSWGGIWAPACPARPGATAS